MPAPAVATIAAQAQGNPLFAVETIRSLIDRDVVVPMEGVYRLDGDVGKLSVPDSLHALLAARLDALDAQLRSLVADAAVLGSSFPAEALVAVSSRDPAAVEAGLAELLRREVFEISADPLSPQRGAYHFSQSLLRQVAYETLARRDRKSRHLAVAAHLRTTFANDGEEVSEVVARHYLDALKAMPDDPDAAALRTEATAALVRAAERAERSGAPQRGAEMFAEAAALAEQADEVDAALRAAGWWERAAAAAKLAADFTTLLTYVERSGALYTAHGRPRDAARCEVLAAAALRGAGRHSDGRQRVIAAMEVLSTDPDYATVEAMGELATLKTFAGEPDAHQCASEALAVAQELGLGAARLAELFIVRGLAAGFLNRYAEAAADMEYAGRLAERGGDTASWIRAMTNLSAVLLTTDAAAAAAAARAAVDSARQRGNRLQLSIAVPNLAIALMSVGDWDEAEQVLRHAVEVDGFDDDSLSSNYVALVVAALTAMRGDPDATDGTEGEFAAVRISEDPQDLAAVAFLDAVRAAAHRRVREALQHARTVVGHADALGIASEFPNWAWPLGVRAAFELGDTESVEQLILALNRYPSGHIPPLLRAERTLARARLRAAADEPDADDALAAAVAELRAVASPYHLAQGLLDRAEHLARSGQEGDAEALRDEARAIGERLRAPALQDRAGATVAVEAVDAG
jgi:tetratricopeptide (TPR) repeat protein